MKWTGFQRLTCLTGVTHHKTHASFQSSSCHAVMNLQGLAQGLTSPSTLGLTSSEHMSCFFSSSSSSFPPLHSMRLNPLSWQRSGGGWVGGGRGREGGPTHTWCAQKCPVSPFVFHFHPFISVFSTFFLSQPTRLKDSILKRLLIHSTKSCCQNPTDKCGTFYENFKKLKVIWLIALCNSKEASGFASYNTDSSVTPYFSCIFSPQNPRRCETGLNSGNVQIQAGNSAV